MAGETTFFFALFTQTKMPRSRADIASGRGLKKPEADPTITYSSNTMNHLSRKLLSLRRMNLAAFFFHVAITFAIFARGNPNSMINLYIMDIEVTSPVNYLIRPTTNTKIISFSIVNAIILFELITAFFHLGNASVWPSRYERWLESCTSPSRWVEYSFSAPIMIALIAVFCGHVNLHVHILLFGLTMTTMFFGWLSEIIVRPDSTVENYVKPEIGSKWTAHFLGYVPLVFVWTILLTQFVRYAQLENDGDSMPTWVYVLFGVEFVLFWSFAGVQFYILNTKPSNFLFGERMYIILSFISKASLSLIILGGTLDIE